MLLPELFLKRVQLWWKACTGGSAPAPEHLSDDRFVLSTDQLMTEQSLGDIRGSKLRQPLRQLAESVIWKRDSDH